MKVTKHTSSSSRTPDKRWSMLGLRLEVGIQDFYQRLFDHNLIPDSQASKETSSRTICPCCPLCSHRLIACSSSSTVTCGANSRCVGANLVRVSRCCSYDTMMFCHDCLIYDSDDLGALSECILCEVRYPPRLMTKFTEANWKKCSEHIWRPREHDDPDICLDCIETIRSHVTCPCGLAWICGLCAQKEIQRSGRRCPRCQTFYCFRRCKYIRACTECRKRTLCKDCAEEDIPDEEGPSLSNKGVVLVTGCELLSCRVCIMGGLHCHECIADYEIECMECGAPLCPNCPDYKCMDCYDFAPRLRQLRQLHSKIIGARITFPVHNEGNL